MTALCGGAASGPKTSAPPGITFLGGEALSAAIQAVLGLSQAWASLIVFAGAQSINPSTLCVTDPPAFPTFTVQDTIDITTGNVVSNPSAFGKLATLAQIAAWYAFCQCNTVATPPPPAPMSYPGGGNVFQPPGTPSVSSGPCWSREDTIRVAQADTGAVPLYWTSLMFPGAVEPNFHTALIPAGANCLTFKATPSGTLPGPHFALNYYDVNFASVSSLGTDWAANTTPISDVCFAIPPTAVHWNLQTIGHGVGGQGSDWFIDTIVQFFCSGGTGGPSAPTTPCCPPDPTLLAQLLYIRGLVEDIFRGLPTAFGSYAESTVHAGLTGQGAVTVSPAAIAVKVVITTDNATLRSSAGDPTYLFDRGFIVPITSEGGTRQAVRLVYNPQLFPLPALTQQVGYKAGAGVTISITELTRGP